MKSKKLLFKALAVFFGVVVVSFAVASVVQNYSQVTDLGAESAKITSNSWEKVRVNQLTGDVNPADVNAAYQEALSLQTKATSANPTINWQFMGPDNVGGKVNAVLWDAGDPDFRTIYAGAATGGLYKTTNFGAKWTKINLENANLKVSTLVQDKDGVVYAGTGADFEGTGIFSSTDGDIFTLVAGTAPVDATHGWAYTNAIGLKKATGAMYVATERGLKYRAPGGAEWLSAECGTENLDSISVDVKIGQTLGQAVAVVDGKVYVSIDGVYNNFVDVSTQYVLNDTVQNPNKLPFENIASVEIAIAPSDNNVVYASVIDLDGMLEGIYRSDDMGMAWRLILPGGTTIDPLGGFGDSYNTIEVFSTDADKIVVASVEVWIGKMINPTGYFDFGLNAVATYFAPYFTVPPLNYQQVPNYVHEFINTIAFRPESGDEFIVGTNGGFYFTPDGATSFYNMNKDLNVTQLNSVCFDGEAPNGHAMVGTNGNGTQYIGGGNTPNAGFAVNTQGIANSGSGGDCEISTINSDYFIFSTQNGLNFIRSEDRGYSSANDFFNVDDLSMEPENPALIGMWESFDAQNSRDSVMYHADTIFTQGGVFNIGDTIYCYSNNYNYPFMHILDVELQQGDSIMVKDIVQNRLFVALENSETSRVFMTTDVLDFAKMPDWFVLGEIEGTPSCLTYSQDADIVYVGTETGKVYRFGNLALAYNYDLADMESPYQIVSKTMVKEFEGRVITSISIAPDNNSRVLVTLGNYGNTEYVYQTNNGLDSIPDFTSINGPGSGLPASPVFSSLIYKTEKFPEADVLFVGTEVGLYISEDGGSSWSFSESDMGIVPVKDIRQQLSNRKSMTILQFDPAINKVVPKNIPGVYNRYDVYVATYGRGLFTCDYQTTPVEPSPEMVVSESELVVFPNPVKSQATVAFNLENSTNVSLQVYDLSGKVVLNYNLGTRMPGASNYSIDCSDLSRGTYIVRLVGAEISKVAKFVKVK